MKSRDSEDIDLAVLKDNIRFVLNGEIEDKAAGSFCIRILAKKQEIADVR